MGSKLQSDVYVGEIDICHMGYQKAHVVRALEGVVRSDMDISGALQGHHGELISHLKLNPIAS